MYGQRHRRGLALPAATARADDSGIGEDPAIIIGADSTKFIFVVESDGSLPVKEIIERALLHIKSRSSDLIEALQEGL